MAGDAKERDLELRFEVVYASRSKRKAEEAAGRLRRRKYRVLTGQDERRTRRGRVVREHQVLVPHGQRDGARAAIAAAPVLVDDPSLPDPAARRRRRAGERSFAGAVTSVAWLFGALLVVAVFLLVLASQG